MDDQTTSFDCYTSPWRNLAYSFRKSRDNWKRKYQDLKRQHKRLQNQVRDVRKSRAHWQGQAVDAGQHCQDLQQEITRLKQQLAAAQAAGEKRG
jgi:peptidoglycan hydrolase CwlO-like protein